LKVTDLKTESLVLKKTTEKTEEFVVRAGKDAPEVSDFIFTWVRFNTFVCSHLQKGISIQV
jgi:hypothetical protein